MDMTPMMAMMPGMGNSQRQILFSLTKGRKSARTMNHRAGCMKLLRPVIKRLGFVDQKKNNFFEHQNHSHADTDPEDGPEPGDCFHGKVGVMGMEEKVDAHKNPQGRKKSLFPQGGVCFGLKDQTRKAGGYAHDGSTLYGLNALVVDDATVYS